MAIADGGVAIAEAGVAIADAGVAIAEAAPAEPGTATPGEASIEQPVPPMPPSRMTRWLWASQAI